MIDIKKGGNMVYNFFSLYTLFLHISLSYKFLWEFYTFSLSFYTFSLSLLQAGYRL